MNQTVHPRRYATTRHPTVAAVLAGTYRFPDLKGAQHHLHILKTHFVLSRHQSEEAGEKGIIFWVKGFELTPDEKNEGYTGNYAVIAIHKLPDGKYTLRGEKLQSELKFHPQRQRPKHKHPNWGHPILRSVKKKRIYQTAEAAQAELQLLHSEYPETTIPLTTKLYSIIYSRQQNPPAQKFVLEIKVNDTGGFFIEAVPNDYRPQMLPTVGKQAVDGEEGELVLENEESPGYFASMIELRRTKKKKGAPTAVPPKEGETVSGADAGASGS